VKTWVTRTLIIAIGVLGLAPLASPAEAARRPVVRVMPLGDSITAGVGASWSAGYRVQLHSRLVAAGLRVDFVGSQLNGPIGSDRHNEGHGGWTIDDLRRGVAGWLATARPDVVLLQAGTNDLLRGDRVETAPARLSALVADVQAWGRRARKPVKIFVAKLPGAGTVSDVALAPVDRAAYNTRVTVFNADVAKVVSTRRLGGRAVAVYLADNSAIGGVLIFDAVHPNDVGYTVMAWDWYAAMRPVFGLRAQAAPVPVGKSARLSHLVGGHRTDALWTRTARGWVRQEG
jgi:lysophospholipase L1-like esterase